MSGLSEQDREAVGQVPAEQVAALIERLMRAGALLDESSEKTLGSGEEQRLRGKAQGVRLAASYVEEVLRTRPVAAPEPVGTEAAEVRCGPCGREHPRDGCADVGCRHNCERWVQDHTPAPADETSER